jgi:hypothetical protein
VISIHQPNAPGNLACSKAACHITIKLRSSPADMLASHGITLLIGKHADGTLLKCHDKLQLGTHLVPVPGQRMLEVGARDTLADGAAVSPQTDAA